jgi:hypothetical protein
VPPVVGTEHEPVVIVTRRRTAKRRDQGGTAAAAMSTLLAMAAVVAAFVAWPYLQPSLRPGKRVARKKQIAAVVDRGESPRVSPPSREEKKPQEQQRAKEPLIPAPPALAARDREPAKREMAVTAVQNITPLPEADQADARVTEDVARTITDAAKAFLRHDYAAAEKALEAAQESSGEEAEPATRVERWRLLLDYARQLDDHVAKALASANHGREYTIGDRTITIIEIGPKGYAYKEAGATRRGPRASLPRVVERAVLKAWYDGDPRPSNGIFLGVHRLLDDDVDLDRVRQEWQQALAGEPATSSIMPILDDPALATRP